MSTQRTETPEDPPVSRTTTTTTDKPRIEDVDGRPTIVLERRLRHAPERVWTAVTAPPELARWFVDAVPWTPAVGEAFEASGQPGRVTELDPPRRIAWEWGAERYGIDIAPDGDGDGSGGGCRLAFTHAFDAAYGPGEQHAAGWEIYFGRLWSLLEGHEVDELQAHAQGVFVHEHGLPAMRFHRRLNHPVEHVWRAVTAPAELSRWFPCDVAFAPDLAPGAPMTFDFGEGATSEGRVLDVVAPRRFTFDWTGANEIWIELLPVADGAATVLSFTHVMDDPEDVVSRNGAGWHVCLDALAAILDDPGAAQGVEAGRTPEWERVYAAYVARGYPSGAVIPEG